MGWVRCATLLLMVLVFCISDRNAQQRNLQSDRELTRNKDHKLPADNRITIDLMSSDYEND